MCSPEKPPHTPKVALSFSAELRNVINERNILTSRTRKKGILEIWLPRFIVTY